MAYVLFAFFVGLFGTAIFNQGLFGNALSTIVFFLLIIPVVFAIGGTIHANKEEDKIRQEEFERKQRVKRGHLEDALTPQQRAVWDILHEYYRTDEADAEYYIYRTKKKHEAEMWSWRHNKELEEKYFAEYCEADSKSDFLQAKVKLNMCTIYAHNADTEAKKLQEMGLLDKYRKYTFWDNFPDNWKLSDEEMEALDYEDDD